MNNTAEKEKEVSKKKFQWWQNNIKPSCGSLRIQLCCDTTIVISAALGSYTAIAWTLGLEASNVHDSAVLAGVLCLQYFLLRLIHLAHGFLDGWSQVEAKGSALFLAKVSLDLLVNLAIRLVSWIVICVCVTFSIMNLRIQPLHSLSKIIIGVSALCNAVILIHTGGAILRDCNALMSKQQEIYNSKDEAFKTFMGRSRIVSFCMQLALTGLKVFIYVCQGLNMLLHLWPLADSFLIACLVGIGGFAFRKSLDSSLDKLPALEEASKSIQNTRNLIWPMILILAHYLIDVIRSIIEVTKAYAIKVLVTATNIGDEVQQNKLEEKSC